MIQRLIDRYKRMRSMAFLRQVPQGQYAFVGMGQHSLTNLYPVLHYLGVPLKYICVTSEQKARMIEKKYLGVKATTSLDTILKDEEIKGVFVSASPSAHFSIASQILKSGKSLFVEKPPCLTLKELDTLIGLQQLHKPPVAMAGLQKRYAPAVQLLKKNVRKERLLNYDLHYLTGDYPEGNALLDLYIHPIDLVCHLFGFPEILSCKEVAKNSYVLMLQHAQIVGTLELSTAYSWTDAQETLKVTTHSGTYLMNQMEELTFMSTPPHVLGLPSEKLHPHHASKEYLYLRNNFTPILGNNQIYSQGYFNEVDAFVSAVEYGHYSSIVTDLSALRPTYETLSKIN